MQKIIVIVGPTAIGKSDLGIKLAKIYNGEIISGDSQQVYRQLDIGTAKVTKQEQEEIKHHLIDVRDVTDSYSAFDFVQEAQKAISEIAEKSKLPIIVGGTGLYIQSLIEGYHLGGQVDQKKVLSLRAELEQLDNEDIKSILEEKKIVIDQYNKRRSIRAIEIETFGKKLENDHPNYDVLLIGLNDDRQTIYDRINRRVDNMIKNGILDEARYLYDYYPEVQATRAIGYKEFFPYFSGEITLFDASEKLKQNTRRFAKRQLTWFKNRMDVTFFDISKPESQFEIKELIENFIQS
ncbi:tRNA dimethylallyltransferase [Streptococcus urinalis FB127-CNA-2]|uniref:tRNA dimethylallyltransferase n=1 Tax=Streptococcus urinalis 2285-97 TaxID=764291 RepID=G5KF32_9STRE|nr:tRNA (adenosine(37)-N6)-dimethylallyltransferase MiaA [Streptococcus urinalis]EHJ57050.1 tRNA dimethylallyltransferase [Streptococcus urinalis 2285-97]EKS21999.1 tRNA dimethylallyltransferase [Streptococcus urinalis FB127-CNA-2]VEF31811.1 tRNA delta(2)-isopentenylpyrophosphate transferase [Streptococcus urinalis]